MKVVRRVVIGLGGAGGATPAAIAIMRIYKQQAYAAYESLSGKKLERNRLGLLFHKAMAMRLMRSSMLMLAQ